MKHLPLGQQDFRGIIEGDFLYVDKTKYIFQLLNNRYYFLSRPRRFGKSLLINTLKEIFSGSKELFKNLWIYDKIDWQVHPVIQISFSSIGHKVIGLEKAIHNMLNELATKNNIKLLNEDYPNKFKELIEKLSEKGKVVLLIDEYDKPIIDYIEDIPQADENREILKNFYSIIKDSDKYLRFFFVTGVSKFSRVSIFSDLNNLNDITIHDDYAQLTGISQQELLDNFGDYIDVLQRKLSKYFPNIVEQIKREYLGYSWDGFSFVYNPFTLLNLFDKKNFGDYWFQTGTPTFLMKLIKEGNYTTFDLENKKVFLTMFEKYEINDISLISLLFQTGYLTIKKVDIRKGALTLGFPNREVERSFSIHLLASLNGGKITTTNSLLLEMTEAMEQNRIDGFMKLLNTLFKGISYTIAQNEESYYHSIFYLVVKMLGFNIESEILTIDGRIDAVLFTENVIYVIEFKTGNTKKAITQIREKGYHLKYTNDKRPIQLFGIDFDLDKKCVASYVVENV